MQFVTTRGEKSIADLAARVFQVPPGDQERLKRAQEALLKANPHLANIQALADGTIVVVVDAPDLKAAADAPTPLQAAARGAIVELQQRIGQLNAAVDEGFAVEMTDVKATAETIQIPQLQRVAASSPQLKELLAKLAADLDGRAKDADSARGQQQRLLAQIDGDLNDLLKRFG